MVIIDCWILVILKDNVDRMVVMLMVLMIFWNIVGLWWVILYRVWKIKLKFLLSIFYIDNVSLYFIICIDNIIFIFVIGNYRWLFLLINMVIFCGMCFLVEFCVEFILRVVILSEFIVECLKIYYNDWFILLLINFWKIKIIKNLV